MIQPFYDPDKTYEENFSEGPFGAFSDSKVYQNREVPEYKLFGCKLYLPFGIPAGPLLNGKYVKAALDKGFDAVVYKTVRSKKYPVNPWPNVLAVDIKGKLTPPKAQKGVVGNRNYDPPNLSITNSFGVPSFDPDFWQKDLSDAVRYAKAGQLVIASFQGTQNSEGNRQKYIADFVLTARLVKETGVKVMEVNLSCPNEGSSHLLCFDIQTTREVAAAVKNEIGDIPLIIKISYFNDQDELKNLIKEVGKTVDGIAAINTIPAKIYDAKGRQALPGEKRLVSGVCGRSIRWAGLEMVKRLKDLKQELDLKYTVIGVGGVTEKKDYLDYIHQGADCVMSATGAMWNPYLAQEIKENNNI